jgi:hypothetical protein
MAVRYGGSFSPPLSDEILASYKTMIDALPASPIKDAMGVLHNCCAKWWDQPESTGEGKPHPVGKGVIVALDKPIADALWEHIPWKQELDMMAKLFDGIDPDTQSNLRNAAFHLLWHAIELEMDREPITTDKL